MKDRSNNMGNKRQTVQSRTGQQQSNLQQQEISSRSGMQQSKTKMSGQGSVAGSTGTGNQGRTGTPMNGKSSS